MRTRNLALLTIFASLLALILLVVVMDSTTKSQVSEAQVTAASHEPEPEIPAADYEYEILPGFIARSGSEEMLWLTQRWHYGSIDFVFPDQFQEALIGHPVHFLANPVRTDKVGIRAAVTRVGKIPNAGSCSKVEIGFYKTGNTSPLARVHYTHVKPTVTKTTPIALGSPNKVGTITRGSWVPVPSGRDDARGEADMGRDSAPGLAGLHRRRRPQPGLRSRLARLPRSQ